MVSYIAAIDHSKEYGENILPIEVDLIQEQYILQEGSTLNEQPTIAMRCQYGDVRGGKRAPSSIIALQTGRLPSPQEMALTANAC